jgi:hypothetical protein
MIPKLKIQKHKVSFFAILFGILNLALSTQDLRAELQVYVDNQRVYDGTLGIPWRLDHRHGWSRIPFGGREAPFPETRPLVQSLRIVNASANRETISITGVFLPSQSQFSLEPNEERSVQLRVMRYESGQGFIRIKSTTSWGAKSRLRLHPVYFADSPSLPDGPETSRLPNRSFAMDLDGDGKQEILQRGQAGSFQVNRVTQTFRNVDNDFRLTRANLIATDLSVANGYGEYDDQILSGDFNGDGKDDLVARLLDGQLAFYQSTGNGFAPPVYSPTAFSQTNGWFNNDLFQKVLVGDFIAGNGKDEIAFRDVVGNFYVFENQDSSFHQVRVFNSSLSQAMGWFSADSQIAVANSDGLAGDEILAFDIYGYVRVFSFDVLTNRLSEMSSTYLGMTQELYWFQGFNRRLVADINGDGREDIIARTQWRQMQAYFSGPSGYRFGGYAHSWHSDCQNVFWPRSTREDVIVGHFGLPNSAGHVERRAGLFTMCDDGSIKSDLLGSSIVSGIVEIPSQSNAPTTALLGQRNINAFILPRQNRVGIPAIAAGEVFTHSRARSVPTSGAGLFGRLRGTDPWGDELGQQVDLIYDLNYETRNEMSEDRFTYEVYSDGLPIVSQSEVIVNKGNPLELVEVSPSGERVLGAIDQDLSVRIFLGQFSTSGQRIGESNYSFFLRNRSSHQSYRVTPRSSNTQTVLFSNQQAQVLRPGGILPIRIENLRSQNLRVGVREFLISIQTIDIFNNGQLFPFGPELYQGDGSNEDSIRRIRALFEVKR